MVENEGVALRAIRWSEILPWISICRSFRLAISLRLMTFGAAAALLTLLGWWQIASLLAHEQILDNQGGKGPSRPTVPVSDSSNGETKTANDNRTTIPVPSISWSYLFPNQSAWEVIDYTVPNRPFAEAAVKLPESAPPVTLENLGYEWRGMKISEQGGPFIYTWAFFNQPVWRILTIGPTASREPLAVRDFFSFLLSAIWSLAVWAFFGAAISRVAAVHLASGEQVGWGAALRWARNKWLAYISAATLPIVGVALISVPILVLGLLMKSDFLAFVAAVIWPLALIGGFIMALLLLGVLLGWPLMWATISVEGTDSFDALNRTYSYVFQRPLRYFFYTIVAAVIGWLGWIVVMNFAASVIWLASWAASWGAGSTRIDQLITSSSESSLARAAAATLSFWAGWVKLLAIGYAFSYFGVAATAIYYLMRRDVDAREMDEVFSDADVSEQKFGLPKLRKDAAGAPEVVENLSPGPILADGQVDVE